MIFKLKINGNHFGQESVDMFKEPISKKFKRICHWLGFYTTQQCKVLNEPVKNGDEYTYDLKIVGKTIYWFYVPVRKIVF